MQSIINSYNYYTGNHILNRSKEIISFTIGNLMFWCRRLIIFVLFIWLTVLIVKCPQTFIPPLTWHYTDRCTYTIVNNVKSYKVIWRYKYAILVYDAVVFRMLRNLWYLYKLLFLNVIYNLMWLILHLIYISIYFWIALCCSKEANY